MNELNQLRFSLENIFREALLAGINIENSKAVKELRKINSELCG